MSAVSYRCSRRLVSGDSGFISMACFVAMTMVTMLLRLTMTMVTMPAAAVAKDNNDS